ITWECARLLKEELEDQKLDDFFFNHVMRLDPHLVRSTVDGVLTDIRVKNEIAHELNQDVAKINERFLKLVHEITGNDDYNPNIQSNPQMKALFIERLRLKSPTGSVDKEARDKMKDDVRTSPEARELLMVY